MLFASLTLLFTLHWLEATLPGATFALPTWVPGCGMQGFSPYPISLPSIGRATGDSQMRPKEALYSVPQHVLGAGLYPQMGTYLEIGLLQV